MSTVDNKLFEQAAEIERLAPLALQRLFHASDDPLLEMPIGQLRVMRILAEGPTTATRLTRQLGLTAAAVSQVVKRLRSTGLVAQDTDTSDHRVKHLMLSEHGADQMARRSHARASHAAHVLAQLPPETVEAMLLGLRGCVSLDSGDDEPS